MTNTEVFVGAVAQTLAPQLFALFGTPPEEMGFPIYDTPGEVETHLQRQFDPVNYWTDEAKKMANDIVKIANAGGVGFDRFDYDSAADVIKTIRVDLTDS